MGTPTAKKRSSRAKPRRKVARTFRLTEGKVEAAQRILGASTATETIEAALDLVVFRQELATATKAALGARIRSPDPEQV